MKTTFIKFTARKRITLFVFTDAHNQVIYSCVANNLIWAKELLEAQYDISSQDEFQELYSAISVYQTELTGKNFKKVN